MNLKVIDIVGGWTRILESLNFYRKFLPMQSVFAAAEDCSKDAPCGAIRCRSAATALTGDVICALDKDRTFVQNMYLCIMISAKPS